MFEINEISSRFNFFDKIRMINKEKYTSPQPVVSSELLITDGKKFILELCIV